LKSYFCDTDFFRFKEAEGDCTEALDLDDRYIKAYSRRITARKELGKLKEAMDGIHVVTLISLVSVLILSI
jgi:hypothetical protein